MDINCDHLESRRIRSAAGSVRLSNLPQAWVRDDVEGWSRHRTHGNRLGQTQQLLGLNYVLITLRVGSRRLAIGRADPPKSIMARSVIFCQNGPKGAPHKWGLSPFSRWVCQTTRSALRRCTVPNATIRGNSKSWRPIRLASTVGWGDRGTAGVNVQYCLVENITRPLYTAGYYCGDPRRPFAPGPDCARMLTRHENDL